MKQLRMPWLSDGSFYKFPLDPALSRDEFVAKYFPKYVDDYTPPRGIKMVRNKAGRMYVQQSTKASVQAQVTKRNNRVDEAYRIYLEHYAEEVALYSKHTTSQ